jgi:hypothetical protein
MVVVQELVLVETVALVEVRHLSVAVVLQTQMEVQEHHLKVIMEVLETQLQTNMVQVAVVVLVL